VITQNDLSDTNGNNNVMGPGGKILHGTHVAGIVAQVETTLLG
jgi:subtilisin family serine protease